MANDVELTKYQKDVVKKLDNNKDSIICKVKIASKDTKNDDTNTKTWIQYKNGKKEVIRSNTIAILLWKGYIREQKIKVPHLTYKRTEKLII